MFDNMFIDMCFLCLGRSNNIKSILLQDEDGIAIEIKIKYFLKELLNFKPEIPKNICTDCLKCLNYVYKFRERCIKNLISLRVYTENITTKNKEIHFSSQTKHNFTEETHNVANTSAYNSKNEITQNSVDQTQTNDSNIEVAIKTEQPDTDDHLDDGSSSLNDTETGNFNEIFIKQEPENDDCGTKYDTPNATTSDNLCLANNIDDTPLHSKTINEGIENIEIFIKDDPLLLEETPPSDSNYILPNEVPEDMTYTDDAEYNSPPPTTAEPNKKLYQCDECEKSFSHNAGLQRHKRSHTGEKPHKCDICNKAFIRKCVLTDHKRTHTGDRPYECDICPKSFFSQSNLIQHKRTHTSEKPYRCDVCEKTFNTPYYLSTHKLIHSGIKNHKCSMCEKAFINENTLKKHVRIHTDEKPFKCDVCELHFRSYYHLNRHKRTHTSDRPYKCDVCGVTYRTVTSIKEHMLKHTGEKPFHCTLCSYKSLTEPSLKIHMQQKHQPL